MDSLNALIADTTRRARRQKRANALGFFLPLGVAVYFLGSSVVWSFGWPTWLPVGLAVAVLGGLTYALRQARRATQPRAIAALLDEKTNGQERFLTYVSLSSATDSARTDPTTGRASDFLARLGSQAAHKAAFFAPKRDLPFRLDRRVPLACVAAVLSGLLFGFASSGGAVDVALPAPEVLLQAIEAAARELADPTQAGSGTRGAEGAPAASAERGTRAVENDHAERRRAAEELRTLVRQLKDPRRTPQDKQRLIEETQKRLNLPVSIPQMLPFDLKLFGADSDRADDPGNQGDSPQPDDRTLAKVNENLEQIKKSLSAAHDSEPAGSGQATDQNPDPRQQSAQAGTPKPKPAGGGIKFDQSPDQSGTKQTAPTAGNTASQQKTSHADPRAERSETGVDPNKAGPAQHRHAARQQTDAARRPHADQTARRAQDSGKPGGQGTGERYYKPGEAPSGFTTKDVRYVKVRIPVAARTSGDGAELTDNPHQAVPATPYSNAPLADRPRDKDAPQQPIPYEYRAILAP